MTYQLRTLAQTLLDALENEAKAQGNWENARNNYTGPVDSYEDAYLASLIDSCKATGDLRNYLKENPPCPCPPTE